MVIDNRVRELEREVDGHNMREMKAETPDSVMSTEIPSLTIRQVELSVQSFMHGHGCSRFSAKSSLCKRLHVKEIEKS